MDLQAYDRILKQCEEHEATLVAVSKTKPIEDIKELMNAGQLDFGENKVQELSQKHEQISDGIHWHMIGHLQRNKVKYMAEFVHLVHSIDSLRLLKEIDKQGKRVGRKIPVLLQMHIAQESSKFGLDEKELNELLTEIHNIPLVGASISGFMGMATFTEDKAQVESEFRFLREVFERYRADERLNGQEMQTLSMGMSGDYEIALACGSNMIRVGSLLFGARNY